ncbi:MAG: zinc ribbon domain-containing protein [Clostridia bacterium]|nr:zinc ribbon domain-containing protein [Clostridia bacterium]
MNNKPKHFKIFKIVGCIGLALAIIGLILTFTGFGNFENNNFMIGAFLFAIGFMMTFVGFINGFSPEIAKMQTQSKKYIQQENKEDLTNIASTTADITKEAVTTTAQAIKQGLAEEKMFCKHCGAQIDIDSVFCNKCGKEQ